MRAVVKCIHRIVNSVGTKGKEYKETVIEDKKAMYGKEDQVIKEERRDKSECDKTQKKKMAEEILIPQRERRKVRVEEKV